MTKLHCISKVFITGLICFTTVLAQATTLREAYAVHLERQKHQAKQAGLKSYVSTKERTYDVAVNNVTDDLLERIKNLGGKIRRVIPAMNFIQIRIAENKVDAVKSLDGVKCVALSCFGRTNKANTSEGDTAHRADEARQLWDVDGTGVKIGVISDSVRYLAEVQASGDLPYVEVLPGRDGVFSDEEVEQLLQEGILPDLGEGTAMLELVHDIAPGASLAFASGKEGLIPMADAVNALVDAGCDIIVDDISFDNESVFRDSVLAQAINNATDKGVIYFSCAINLGNKLSGTSCVYEGDFVPEFEDGTVTIDGVKYVAHRFGLNADDQECRISSNTVENTSASRVFLIENVPDRESSQGYEILVQNKATGNMCSGEWASATDSILYVTAQMVGAASLHDCNIYVIKPVSSENRYFRLMARDGVLQYATSNSTFGHCAAEKAITVAAASGASGAEFVGKEKIRVFSADGPRKMFFKPDGSQYTTSLLSDGGITLLKPEFTAADKVSTATPTAINGKRVFCPFNGTSAAAPHLAAIGALMLQANSSISRDEMVDMMKQSTFGDGMWDETYGYGIVDAYTAVRKAKESMYPPNDDFDSAEVISGESGSVWGVNTYATSDWIGGSVISVDGIWWKWTSSFDGYMTFDTGGSEVDNMIAVYRGLNGGTAERLDFAFSSKGLNAGASVTIEVTKGETYHIMIDSWGDEKGVMKLNWHKPSFFGPDLCFAPADGWPSGFYLYTESSGAACSSFSPSDTVYLNCRVINAGNDSVTNSCRLLYEILDSDDNVVEVWYSNESLFQSLTRTGVFSEFDYVSAGVYTLRCTIDPDMNVPDGDRSNNTISISFTKTLPTALETPEIWYAIERYGTIRLSWSTVNGAEGYLVYRSRSTSMPSEPYATISSNDWSFEDTEFFADKTYCYWVVAMAGSLRSEPSEVVKIQTTGTGLDGTGPDEIVDGGDPEGDFSLTAAVSSGGVVTLQWPAYNSATSYYIYRSDEPVMPPSEIECLTRNHSASVYSFSDDISSLSDSVYYYWVEAKAGTKVLGVSDRAEVSYVPPKPECDVAFYAHKSYGWLHPVYLSSSTESINDGSYSPRYSFDENSPMYLNVSIANFDDTSSVTIDDIAVVIADENGNILTKTIMALDAEYGPRKFNLFPFDISQEISDLPPGNYCYAVYIDPYDKIGDPCPEDNVWISWFAIKASDISLNEALDCDDLSFTAYGDTPPFVRLTDSIAGNSCIQFGPQETNTMSSLLHTKIVGPGTLSFKWKATSVDYMAWIGLYVNQTLTKYKWGSDDGWEQVTLELEEGTNSLIWVLATYEHETEVLNSGWLDDIQWTPAPTTCDIGFYTPSKYGWKAPLCLSSAELEPEEYSTKTVFVPSDRIFLHYVIANYVSSSQEVAVENVSLILKDESGMILCRKLLNYTAHSIQSNTWQERRNIEITSLIKDLPMGRYCLELELDPKKMLNDTNRINNTANIWLEIKEETVSVETVDNGTLEVPVAWFGRYDDFKTLYGDDYAAALGKKSGKRDAFGREMYVWEDYVIGTNPTDQNDKFMAYITMSNGCPHIEWTPNLNTNGNKQRVYTIYGTSSLDDAVWQTPTNATHRFFKVSVAPAP